MGRELEDRELKTALNNPAGTIAQRYGFSHPTRKFSGLLQVGYTYGTVHSSAYMLTEKITLGGSCKIFG